MNHNLKNLLLVCFIDMMGYALFSPIIAFLFLDGEYSLLAKGSMNRYTLFGFFLSIYSIVQVFSSPYLALIAQRRSKKFVLLCSLVGNLIGYLFCAYGVLHHNILYLFVGSACAGLLGASASMINAFISSESKAQKWSQNYSLFGAVIGSSFIVGPLLSKKIIASFEGLSAFYIIFLLCSVLCFINLIIVTFFVKESSNESLKIENNISFFSKRKFFALSPSTLSILAYLFCIYFSWLFFLKFYQVYLFEVHFLSEGDCLLMTSFLGFCCCLWQAIRFFFKVERFDYYGWLMFCTTLMLLNFFAYQYLTSFSALIALTLSMSFTFAVIVPSTLSLLFSKGTEEKTYKASLYQSIKALAQILAPLSSGFILSTPFLSPVFLNIVLMAFALGLLFFRKNIFCQKTKISEQFSP